MINYNRVRRIKYVIYLFIVLLFLVPAVLMIAFGVKMARIMPTLDRIIAENSAASAQAPQYSQLLPGEGEPDDSGYLEPGPEQYPVPQGTSGSGTSPAAAPPEPPPPEPAVKQTEPEKVPVSDTPQGGQEQSKVPPPALGVNTAPEPAPEENPPLVKQPPYGDIDSPNTGIRP